MNAPAPFIIGFPRSGTTLLRLMLDAHPDLAIPPETGFTGDLATKHPCDAAEAWQRITHFPADAPGWPDFRLDAETFRMALEELSQFSVGEAVRTFYKFYAARFGKARWGDKTPTHLHQMKEIAALLPEARFIHIVRDGRDSSCSLRRQWFAPSQEVHELAAIWSGQIRYARQQALQTGGYLEVMFENLILDPSRELERICTFIDLPFHPAMLRHHESAPQRLDEHQERRTTNGTLIVSREQRILQQSKSRLAPDKSQVGIWRTQMSDGEKVEFERVAGDLIAELGYLPD